MTILTTFLPEQLAGERRERACVRRSLEMWSRLALPAGQAPAAHHKLLISALADVGSGKTDRLMVLMPPGAAKSTYGSVNMLLGTLAAMATSVVSYWVGSSVGSARKDAIITAPRA